MKKVIKLALIYLVLQFLVSTIVTTCTLLPKVFEIAASGEIDPNAVAIMVSDNLGLPMALSTLISGVLMSVYLIWKKHVVLTRQSFSEVSVRVKLMSIPFIIGALYFCNLITEACGLPDFMNKSFASMCTTGWGILAIAIVAPIAEELLFRGAMEGHLLRQGRSPRTAILISALIFGIIHFNPAQCVFAFLLGLAFGWLYYRTGSVIPGIVAHILNNTIAAILYHCAPEQAEQTVTEQYGSSIYTILLILSLALFAGGYYMLNRELPKSPRKHIE